MQTLRRTPLHVRHAEAGARLVPFAGWELPVKYTFDAVVMSGKLTVLKDDPTGVFYRLTDAVPAK